jgi:predicted GNAT superfamily acetyltransferase
LITGKARAAGALVVRKCETLDEFNACVALQREIWGEADLEVEPATLFLVAAHTGGQVLGAFDGERLVGYTLAIVGLLEGRPYLHSHMTGVHAEYRDRGVGRLLKRFQRDEALGRGIRLIQWTFDPFELRNAHFNLDRLGAICRQYRPNLYGVTTSPLHRGLPTDRLLAEWFLDSARVVAAIENLAKEPVAGPAAGPAAVVFPAEIEEWKRTDSPELAKFQGRVRGEFTQWFAKGYAALATRTTAEGTSYLLAPWSDF